LRNTPKKLVDGELGPLWPGWF